MTLKKIECERDRGGRTQSSRSSHDLQTFWETGNRSVNSLTDDFLLMFGYFWLFFSFFFRCTAILSLSLSFDNAFISPHPPKKSPLSPSLSLPTRGKLKFWKILIHYNTKLIILLVSLCYDMNFAISLLTTIKNNTLQYRDIATYLADCAPFW